MLEYIRNSAQSLGVKIAFGVIILVFVFWGIGNYNDRDYSNVVAMVNGEPIVALEFEKAYQNAEEYLLRNNPGLTREQLVQQHLGRQILRDLIQMTLLAQEARRTGVVVTPEEMRLVVGENKVFQNDQGKFDPEVYKRVLSARRMSPAEFEKDLANQLMRDKMFGLITASVWIDPEEARHRYEYLREKRSVDYLFLPAAGYADKVELSDAELQAYYDSHKADFAIPPMADIAYIEVAPEKLVSRKDIDGATAQAWYDANKSRYERKEQVKASHILVPLAEDADENAVKAANERIAQIQQDLAGGKKFVDVADAVNEANAAGKGGEVGWIGRGETVPQFEEVVFALQPGQVSKPFRTQFGMHLALVTEKHEAGTPPFAEVADDVYAAIAAEQGLNKLHDVLDNLIEDNILNKPLEASAVKYSLTAATTGLVDKTALAAKLNIKPDAADALLATAEGSPLDTALEAGGSYIVARVIKQTPASTKPFAEVSKTIGEILTHEKSLNFAINAAKEILDKIKAEPLSKALEQYPAIKRNEIVERTGSVPGFAADTALSDSIFGSAVASWLSAPMAVETDKGESGAILVHVNGIEPSNTEEFASVSDILGRAARQERMEGVYELFMGQLLKNAKVEITNPGLIDRVNQ